MLRAAPGTLAGRADARRGPAPVGSGGPTASRPHAGLPPPTGGLPGAGGRSAGGRAGARRGGQPEGDARPWTTTWPGKSDTSNTSRSPRSGISIRRCGCNRDHFWAQCLAAVCWLQLRHPEAAHAGFTACLKREPEFAWLLYPPRPRLQPQFRDRSVRGEAAPLRRGRGRLPPGAGAARAEAERRAALHRAGQPRRPAIPARRSRPCGGRPEDGGQPERHADAGVRDPGGCLPKAGSPSRGHRTVHPRDRAQAGLAPLYRARADVVLESRSPTPAAARAGARRPGSGDPAGEAGQHGPGARPHQSRPAAGPRRRDLHGALAACDAAIERVRDYDDAHLLRLELLRRLKRHDDVIRSCDAAHRTGKGVGRDLRAARPGPRGDQGLPGRHRGLHECHGALGRPAHTPESTGLALHRRRRARPGIARLPRGDPARSLERRCSQRPGSGTPALGEHREAVADAEKAISLGEPTADHFYKAARVYALAAVVASAEVRKKGQETVLLVTRYQDRGADLLREAIRRLPADRRASFVKDVILVDPDLRTLRRRVSVDGPGRAGRFDGPVRSKAEPMRWSRRIDGE